MFFSPKLQPNEHTELNTETNQKQIFKFQLIQDYFNSLPLYEKEKILSIDN